MDAAFALLLCSPKAIGILDSEKIYPMTDRMIGAIAVVLSAAGFGAMAIFARFAYAGGADVIAVLFLRFLIAAVLMILYVRQSGRPWPQPKSLWILAVMGGLIYVSQSFAFFSALQHASAGLVALLLYLYPCLVTILGALLFKQPLGIKRLGAVALAFMGTALTVWGGLAGEPLGIALGVLSALLYSAYVLIGSRVLAQEDPYASATIVMVSAAVSFGLLTMLYGPAFPVTPAAWMSVAGIALCSTVVGMVGLFIGMRHLGAADAATLSTLEPVVTILLAAVFLNEALQPLQLVGGAVILVAVVWLARIGAGESGPLSKP